MVSDFPKENLKTSSRAYNTDCESTESIVSNADRGL